MIRHSTVTDVPYNGTHSPHTNRLPLWYDTTVTTVIQHTTVTPVLRHTTVDTVIRHTTDHHCDKTPYSHYNPMLPGHHTTSRRCDTTHYSHHRTIVPSHHTQPATTVTRHITVTTILWHLIATHNWLPLWYDTLRSPLYYNTYQSPHAPWRLYSSSPIPLVPSLIFRLCGLQTHHHCFHPCSSFFFLLITESSWLLSPTPSTVFWFLPSR
jgi:hypothetical protein